MTVTCSVRDNVISNSPHPQTAARMGCGHSKINIYPRKSSKTKQSSSKKSVTPDKAESEEEDGIENETECKENLEDCDTKKIIRIKTSALVAHMEISSSQQDFFKMLDEKIENGPDYNSEAESEKVAERLRLRDLFKEWETASINSHGSQSGTPKRSPGRREGSKKGENAMAAREMTRLVNDAKGYIVQVSQNVIHQSYGIPPHQEPALQQIAYRNGELINQQRNPQAHYQQYKGPIAPNQLPPQPGQYDQCPRNYHGSASGTVMGKSGDVIVQKHYELT